MNSLLNFSFPKELQLRKASQYDEIFGNSKRLKTRHFDILYRPNVFGYPRIGVVVAKKNVSGAVGRNRVKRILREIFRMNKPLFGSIDIIIVAKKHSELVDYSSALEEIIGKLRSDF